MNNNLLCHVIHTATRRCTPVIQDERLLPVIVVCLKYVPCGVVCANIPDIQRFLS